jgi:hypothetical protein
MSETFRDRAQAGVVLFGPLFLMAAIIYHPYISDLTNPSEVAGAMTEGTAQAARWGLVHIAVGAGFGFLLLSFLGVRSYLSDAGEQRWSALSVPFLVLGTVFSAFLPAMETAMVAAVETGADPVDLQRNLSTWFVPMLISSAVLSGIGVVLLAAGIVSSGAFDAQRARIIAGVLVLLAVSRFVPQGRALYAGALAGVIALTPIAVQMWRGGRAFSSGKQAVSRRGGPAYSK